MSSRRDRAPTEPVTRIPLPFVPDNRLPLHPVVGESPYTSNVPFQEHHAFYPDAVLATRGLGGAALRNVRVQFLERDWHVEYHQQFRPPLLPDADNEFDTFQAVVFATAGFMSDLALRPGRHGMLEERPLSPDDRTKLLRNGHVRVADYTPVRNYLLDYIVQHGLPFKGGKPVLQEALIDEFLFGEEDRRMALGLQLLEYASGRVTRPISRDFERASHMRLLPQRRASDAGRFVCNLLALERRGGPNFETFGNLFYKLADAAGVVLPDGYAPFQPAV